jgi:hypothetical protein
MLKKGIIFVLIVSLFLNGYLGKQILDKNRANLEALSYQVNMIIKGLKPISELIASSNLKNQTQAAFLYSELVQTRHAANSGHSLVSLTRGKYSEIGSHMGEFGYILDHKYIPAIGRLAGIYDNFFSIFRRPRYSGINGTQRKTRECRFRRRQRNNKI